MSPLFCPTFSQALFVIIADCISTRRIYSRNDVCICLYVRIIAMYVCIATCPCVEYNCTRCHLMNEKGVVIEKCARPGPADSTFLGARQWCACLLLVVDCLVRVATYRNVQLFLTALFDISAHGPTPYAQRSPTRCLALPSNYTGHI